MISLKAILEENRVEAKARQTKPSFKHLRTFAKKHRYGEVLRVYTDNKGRRLKTQHCIRCGIERTIDNGNSNQPYIIYDGDVKVRKLPRGCIG